MPQTWRLIVLLTALTLTLLERLGHSSCSSCLPYQVGVGNLRGAIHSSRYSVQSAELSQHKVG